MGKFGGGLYCKPTITIITNSTTTTNTIRKFGVFNGTIEYGFGNFIGAALELTTIQNMVILLVYIVIIVFVEYYGIFFKVVHNWVCFYFYVCFVFHDNFLCFLIPFYIFCACVWGVDMQG